MSGEQQAVPLDAAVDHLAPRWPPRGRRTGPTVTADDRERWDARHARRHRGRPACPRTRCAGTGALLPAAGRALDVACGRGAVAVWLAVRGFAVDAVDVSAVGLAAAAELAAVTASPGGCGGGGTTSTAGCPAGCPGPYDVVVCQRFRDAAAVPGAARAARGPAACWW